MEETVKNFFTLESIGTFVGASGVVTAVSNTFRVLIKKDSLWPCFITALLVALLGAYYSKSLNGIVDILLVFFNGCLIFTSASGIQETAVRFSTPHPRGDSRTLETQKVKWLSSWFH